MPKIHPQAIPYSKDIANKLKEGIRGGLVVTDLFASIQHLQNAPGSIQTMYKLYKTDMDAERAELKAKVGTKVIDQALAGDFKSQEFFLRSRGGWSPQSTVTEVEADTADADTSAIDSLMAALGKLEEESEEES